MDCLKKQKGKRRKVILCVQACGLVFRDRHQAVEFSVHESDIEEDSNHVYVF